MHIKVFNIIWSLIIGYFNNVKGVNLKLKDALTKIKIMDKLKALYSGSGALFY